MIFRQLPALSLVLLGAILVPGCGAGDGGVCQVPGDCAAGLICTCKLGGGPDSRGICHATEPLMCGSGNVDAFVPLVDAGDAAVVPDVGTDANADAGSDGGTDGGTDAASSDVGTDTSSDVGADAPG